MRGEATKLENGYQREGGYYKHIRRLRVRGNVSDIRAKPGDTIGTRKRGVMWRELVMNELFNSVAANRIRRTASARHLISAGRGYFYPDRHPIQAFMALHWDLHGAYRERFS